jgi:hypothetical protein
MVQDNVRLEDVTIGYGGYRNFSGIKTEYNKAGDRKFSIFLPQDVADELEAMGWYIKHKPPYREGDDPQNQMDISVAFDPYPPTVILESYDGVRTYLNEDNVCVLDNTDIERADLEIRPYNWEVNGKTGTKAYVKELVVKAKPPRRALNASMHRSEEEG